MQQVSMARLLSNRPLLSRYAIFLLCLMVGLLLGCQSNSPSVKKQNLDRYGTDPEDIRELEADLVRQDIEVINIGEDYLISLPGNRIFHGPSPRIKWGAYRDLNLVAAYLHQFSKVTVMVVGHTDDSQPEDRALALSRARAQNIADYLWSQNIDARVLHAKGEGSHQPIASNATPEGREHNQRIEIVFRKLMV
jgi:intracellular multiplication protein IcmN